jgi:ribose-phosphate pyrophosphokinase
MKNADVVIIDDFVDTGETIAALAKRFKAQGANKVYVCASHAICSEDSISLIDKSQVDVLVTTNSLPLPEACSSKIEQMSLGPLLSRVIWTEHFRSNLKNFEDEDDETKDLY